MANRNPNSNTRGGAFDAATIEAVWKKGTVEANNDQNTFRKDRCGMWMLRTEYGNPNSPTRTHKHPHREGAPLHARDARPGRRRA